MNYQRIKINEESLIKLIVSHYNLYYIDYMACIGVLAEVNAKFATIFNNLTAFLNHFKAQFC